MRPVIGLIPAYDTEKKQCFLRPQYARAVQKAGGLAFILPLTEDHSVVEEITDLYDGFLFTGGADLSPALYGEDPLPCTGHCVVDREKMESALIESILRKKKPVLGICRGMQFLNVYFGGTFFQDLLTMRKSRLQHWQKTDYSLFSHTDRIIENSALAELLKKETLQVNSMHHQGIKTLGNGLEVMALSEDGLIEAIRKPDYPFLWGIQWHPEFLTEDPDHLSVFQAFINAAARIKQQ